MPTFGCNNGHQWSEGEKPDGNYYCRECAQNKYDSGIVRNINIGRNNIGVASISTHGGTGGIGTNESATYPGEKEE